MLEIEIDGKKVEVPDGSTIMDAAHQVGSYIPHFCYHKKLSIAANCRMCLVQVEKAPKPLPACATPVTNGMKVFTHSDLAVKAQKGVMEFLLINHPLDCPICDQGGECQLQDLSVGYGGVKSRYTEEKRVVFHKNVGPLISMEEMSRCIHCTRCVRFGQEIAGVMELGMTNRNMHSEITAFVGKTVDSELSGNMIDLCPVGALTSKPFRYAARTWELQRRKSVSPHDSVGANLQIQVKHNEVKRVLPRENEDVNECWISDKDRFSYEALNSAERLTKPMVKQGGEWKETDWNVALDYVAHGLKDIARNAGGEALGFLVSPHATLEELTLARKLAAGLGCGNVDFRLRQNDFSADGKEAGAPWLGMKLTELGELDAALVVGSFLRKDHPLIAQRLRQGAKKGTQVSMLHVAGDDNLIELTAQRVVAPAELASALAAVVKAAAEAKGVAVPAGLEAVAVCDGAKAIAATLVTGEKKAIFLGNTARQHPQAAQLQLLALELGKLTGATVGILGEAANSVGGYLAGATPTGLNARQMVEQPRQGYVLIGAEPEFDFADGQKTVAALKQAKMVVLMSAFQHRPALDYADAMLAIAPYTETSGTFVNTEGRVQSFNGVVRPLGDARPAWKVLRVLGNVLNLPGFDYETSEAVRDEVLGAGAEFAAAGKLSNALNGVALNLASGEVPALQRIADVPIHFADPLARRAPALQSTVDGKAPTARAAAATLAALGIAAGDSVKVKQGDGVAVLVAKADETVPAGCLRVAAGHASTAGLGNLFGAISVERA
ncbi:NADH-quinone oxidoreductase subunit NuoG [Oryzomicrobium sp.]|uniref:NADH-quinone oxidoreductase subunit NuoG n=1 Tax=Oryzomicrobium sp. TaxID=1911578 RepID=UPI0025F4B45D|nr:NADH-quinone oxidoreductase subunit NuoG [Oryzomicrobium sp.]MCE1244615.1 NADH-quinone oxidoreductase subunit NuoG [Oryzomicrobium sp.]